MTHEVFISYSSTDKIVADAVCATLEGRKIRCWIAPRDVPPGHDWTMTLVDAIETSLIFVLILSKNSNLSKQVIREVAEAVETGIPIIPLRIEEIEPTQEMRYYIKTLQWLDAMSPPLERHLGKLADSVQAWLSVEEQQYGADVAAIKTPASTRLGKFRKKGEIVGAQVLESIKGIAPAGPPIWRDEFDTATLNTVWYWLNENLEMWTLRKRPGYLRIHTAPGKTGSQNLLLRPVYPGDFYIRTHLIFKPNTNYQFAGLVIYQDQHNFLQFGRAFCMVPDRNLGNGLYFDYIRDGGWVNGNYATDTKSSEAAFLRLGYFAGKFWASHSEDGVDWSLVGIHNVHADFNINAVGLTASQSYSGEAVPADFDYFELERIVNMQEGWQI